MACKYQNPPVIYAVAKVIFKQGVGSHSDEKYQKLLESLKPLGFNSYQRSNVTAIQLKQADNSFSVKQAESARLAYFNSNREVCVLIGENVIELRVSYYTNHSFFLNTFKQVLDVCYKNKISTGIKIREIELNFVDLFVPHKCSLQEMFETITLPNEQFHSEPSDVARIGSINFTRVIAPGNLKVVVNLEQLPKNKQQGAKFLPNILMEPDELFIMPIDTERLFLDTYEGDYAIVHTGCGALMDEDSKYDTPDIRNKFENLYLESIKTFDHMISTNVCNKIWKPTEANKA